MHHDALAQVLSPPLKYTPADGIAERVRNAILSGQLAPEERLTGTMLFEMNGLVVTVDEKPESALFTYKHML